MVEVVRRGLCCCHDPSGVALVGSARYVLLNLLIDALRDLKMLIIGSLKIWTLRKD